MIEYVRQIQMKRKPQDKHIKYEAKDIKIPNFNMNNFTIKENSFEKYLPYRWDGGYLLVTKDMVKYKVELYRIKMNIIAMQVLLLMLFAYLSYMLSKRALLPMQDAIVKLDNFAKDIIHDINTPVTAMFLNIKLLESKEQLQESKPLQRIKRSLEDIGNLQKNLSALLQEETMILQKESLFDIVSEVVATHRKIYPEIRFILVSNEVYVMVNKDTLKQIIINLLSNASKYNVKDGYVKIYMQEQKLCIEDGGIGIKNPEMIFERTYKEHSSGYGIGLDIVKRLCDAMAIEISVSSKLGEGSVFSLGFKS